MNRDDYRAALDRIELSEGFRQDTHGRQGSKQKRRLFL